MSRVPPSQNHRHWPAIVACLAMLVLPVVAQAAIDEYPTDKLLEGFNGVLGTWSAAVNSVADRLFWSLALISLTWTMCMMLFKRADFGELFAELVRFIIFTGLFWWLLDNGGGADGLIASILESGRLMGADGSAGDGGLRPSALLDSAFHVFNEVAEKSASKEWTDADKIVGLLLATVIVALVAVAAVSMMLIIVMTWILAYAGLFLLGFGGARWTSGVAINYYKHVLAVGMSYFVMLLLAGVAETFLKDYSDAVAADITLPHLAILLTAAIALVALLVRIPALVSSMVLGSRFGGAGGASFSGHVMAMGGAAIATGVGHASSGAQALYSAYSAPSAAPPPTPMISMPTIQLPQAPAASGGAAAPIPTPIISVQHLDGNGMNPPQVALNTHGMYPPPAGAAQSSVFGAMPSAQDVARAQVQAVPGAVGGAASADAPAAPATSAAPAAATATEPAADRASIPSVPGAAAPAADRDATPASPIDAEVMRRNAGGEPPLSATNLAASTASLPASPGGDRLVSALDPDDDNADVGKTARRPAETPVSGFSSFASQPLSGSALPPSERGNEAGRGSATPVRDGPDKSPGGGSLGNAPSLRQPTGPVPSGTSPSAPPGRPAGRTPADLAASAPRGSVAASSPAAASPASTSSAGSGDRDAARRALVAHGGNTPGNGRHAAPSVAEGNEASSPTAVSRVVPGADKQPAAGSASESVSVAPQPFTTATGAATDDPRRQGWWKRILRALRRRLRRGRSDDDAG